MNVRRFLPAAQITFDEKLTTVANHNRLMKRVHSQVVRWHYEEIIPRHFANNPDTAPGGGYGYRKRNEEYLKAKERKFHHRLPLVWTGRLKKRTMSMGRITATRKRGRLVIRPFYFRTSHALKPEIERITPAEERRETKFMKDFYLKEVKTDRYKRKRRRKSKG